MATTTPQIKDHELYRLLRSGKIDDFNQRKASGESCDLTGADFRSVDLTGLDADGLDLSNCYFRMCNLRGVDFSTTRLQGATRSRDYTVTGTRHPDEIHNRLSTQDNNRYHYARYCQYNCI